MKKISFIIILLVGLLIPTVSTAKTKQSLENFNNSAKYVDGQFTDVSNGDWFKESVKSAFNLGLMKGTTDTYFNANSNISLAEAIVLAARLHSIYYYGSESFEQGEVWYQTYVDYALQNGIIDKEFDDYNKKASRGEFVYILSKAFPEIALEEINTIEDESIPDIPKTEYYYKAAYKLYRAGILTGNDEYGTFAPYSNIDRASVAAIVSRMAKVDQRKQFKLKKYVYFPLTFDSARIGTDILGYLNVYLTVKNNGSEDIDAFNFLIRCYDAYGDPVYYYDYGSNEFSGYWTKSQTGALKAYGKTDGRTYWNLMGYSGVKKMHIAFTKCHTVDGKTYELDKEDYKWKSLTY